jgi:pilus assembly protein CpaF
VESADNIDKSAPVKLPEITPKPDKDLTPSSESEIPIQSDNLEDLESKSDDQIISAPDALDAVEDRLPPVAQQRTPPPKVALERSEKPAPPVKADSFVPANKAPLVTPVKPAMELSLVRQSQTQRDQAKAIQLLSQRLQQKASELPQRPLTKDETSRQKLFDAALRDASDIIASSEYSINWDAKQLAHHAVQELVGWGPIEDYLSDEQITAISINGSADIHIEQNGQFAPTVQFFSSENALMQTLERVLATQGLTLNCEHHTIEMRMPNGTTLQIIKPPVAARGISVLIHPPRHTMLSLAQLAEQGVLDTNMATFLETCVRHRANILIAGDPSSGRSSLLQALAQVIPAQERVITLEHVNQLQLTHPHWISLCTQPPELSGTTTLNLNNLLTCALRFRPQHIAIDDIDSSAFQQLLSQMLLGLNGIIFTTRASSIPQLLSRLALLLPESLNPHQQLGEAIDIVVQINKFACGTRKITSICELNTSDEDVLQYNEIFCFHRMGVDRKNCITGEFVPTGTVPQLCHNIKEHGEQFDDSMFQVT